MIRVTHIGGPTALIELDGWRVLTDPTFDPPGKDYRFGWGTGSRKLAGPAVAADALGEIDAVLITHDHHDDNLDPAGRALLPSLGQIVTTRSGAGRIGGTGLEAWETTELTAPGRSPLRVQATPCRHGPPLSHPIVGDVIGFALNDGAVWISGDTVLYDGVRSVADRLTVDVALIHMGGVQFPVTGPLRYTMTGRDALALCSLIEPRVAVPIHYEGWKHFREGRSAIERVDAGGRFRWIEIGVPTEL